MVSMTVVWGLYAILAITLVYVACQVERLGKRVARLEIAVCVEKARLLGRKP